MLERREDVWKCSQPSKRGEREVRLVARWLVDWLVDHSMLDGGEANSGCIVLYRKNLLPHAG